MLRIAHMVASLIACGLPAHVEAASPSSLSIVKAVKKSIRLLKIQFKVDKISPLVILRYRDFLQLCKMPELSAILALSRSCNFLGLVLSFGYGASFKRSICTYVAKVDCKY